MRELLPFCMLAPGRILWHTARMKHVLHTCPNGLTLLIVREPAHPVASFQVWVGTGSALEGEYAGSGISHLLEHMVFKGAGEYDAAGLNEEVSRLGGQWNAYTSTDRTVYHIDGPAAHWQAFLHILLQLTLHPTFPEDEFEREREVIRREMDMYNDDPQDAAYRALVETLFKAHPRRLPVIGNRNQFDAIGYADMVAYHRAHYVPGKMFLCIAGDVQPEQIITAVEAEVADIPAAPLPPAATAQEPRQWGTRTCRREFAQPTSTLMLAWRIPHAAHPDAAALTLLSSILGEGRAAWLYTHFHDELALAHDMSTTLLPARHGEGEGAFVIEADVDRELRDTLRDTLLEFIQALPQAEFTEGRLRVCRQLKAKHLRQLSTVQGIAAAMGASWHLARNPESMQEWAQALRRVTDEDLARVATTYFSPERLVEVSIDPTDTNTPSADTQKESSLPPAVEYTLPNGLRLVMRQDSRVPQVYASLVLGAGCPATTAETAGINSLLAECLLKGTRTRTSAQVADALENLGGSITTEAGNNTLSLQARVLSEDTDTMLELLADVILHPVIPQEALNTEKEAIIADILEQMEDPAALAFRHLRTLCFGTTSYGNHPDGTAESVRALTREQLLAHHTRIACADNAVLAVVGDIDPAAIRARVEKLFAAMPTGAPLCGSPTPKQQAGDSHLHCDKEQAVLALAVPACHVGSPELPMQLLFDEWCHDMAGPIFAEIREKRGLAYYASSASLLGIDTGCMYFYLGTAPEHLAEARCALHQTLEKLAATGMPEDALERARATVLSARLLARQSCRKLCAGMAVDTLLGLGCDYADQLPAQLAAITPQAMQQFMAKLLDPTATRTWVSVAPKQ